MLIKYNTSIINLDNVIQIDKAKLIIFFRTDPYPVSYEFIFSSEEECAFAFQKILVNYSADKKICYLD